MARKSLKSRLDENTANRLVPELPQEPIARERAELMASLWQKEAEDVVPAVAASGPFGLTTPDDLRKVVQQIQQSWEKSVPQLFNSFRQPGGIDFLSKVSRDLIQRFVARGIKLVVGAQEMREQNN